MTSRSEIVAELQLAGWPSVAADVADGVPQDVVLSRLHAIGEGYSDAAEIIACAPERLFTPAPEPMPGQAELNAAEGWDG